MEILFDEYDCWAEISRMQAYEFAKQIDEAFARTFNIELPKYQIKVSSRHAYPQCFRLFEPMVINLSVEPWYYQQFCYQLSHEMCHLCLGEGTSNKFFWIEESICELASWIFMQKVNYGIFNYNSCSDYITKAKKRNEPFDLSRLFYSDSTITQYLENEREDRPKNSYFALQIEPLAIKYGDWFWRYFSQIVTASESLSFRELFNYLAEVMDCGDNNPNDIGHQIRDEILKVLQE